MTGTAASFPPLSRLHRDGYVAAVWALVSRCDDYFMLQDGEPATLKDAQALFDDVPPGRFGSELAVFGHHGTGGLEAVAALLPDHPEQAIWYLPLMVVDPALRGRGVGRALHADLVTWASLRGAQALQLVVLDTNGGGEQFWRTLGYREIGRVEPSRFKRKQHSRIELRLDLDPA